MEQSGTAQAGSDGDATQQVKQSAQEMGQQAAEKGKEAANAARGRAREQVDQRSTQAGEQLGTLAGDTRTVGEELRKQGKEQPAKIAEQAADRVEKVGGYLRDSDADTILRDVEDFGRKQPLAVAAGGFVIGLLASRFLKASSADRYRTANSTPGQMMPGYTAGGRSVYGNGGQLAGSEGTGEGVGAGKGTRPTGLPAHQ